MRVALKIDLAMEHGTTTGLLPLLELLQEYGLKGSFFVYPGEDGKAPGLMQKVATWFSRNAKSQLDAEQAMSAIVEAGHELGLLGGHCARWVKHAAYADADWTAHQMALAREAFEKIMGYLPKCFAAPCWQVNAHLLGLEERMEFRYASDVRGRFPFLPILHNMATACPQIPTTLPTLTEALAVSGNNPDNVHEYLYAESRHLRSHGHVFTIDAEQDAMHHLDILEKLFVMWKGQEGFIRSLGDIQAEIAQEKLPRHQIGWDKVPGRKEYLAQQSVPVNE